MADERRSSVRGDRFRRFEDPSKSGDPRVVAVLEQLAEISNAQSSLIVRAEFRDELRAQLVAITPRVVSEYAPSHSSTEVAASRDPHRVAAVERPRPSPRPRQTSDDRRPRRSFLDALRSVPLGRPLAVVASLVTVLALVLGGAVYLSQDAVPGDTLYGLKRASERFELSRADTDAERASDYLDFATTRVQEARELVSRASSSAAGNGPLADGVVSAQTAKLITEALGSADGDTQTASRLLGGVAVDSASARPLVKLTDWAPSQFSRLAEIRAATPEGTPVNAAAAKSTSLLQAAKVRATSLQQRVDCNCLKNAPSDAYGPLPTLTGPSTTPTQNRTAGAQPSRAPGTTGSARTTRSRPTTSAPSPRTSARRTTAPRTPLVQLPSLSLPTGSKQTSRPPGLDLCKINLLGIRLCPSPTK